jgi:hypothetical protein
MGEIPEEFVFLTEPGKTVTSVFDSTNMGSPDEVTTERWIKNTMEFAQSDLIRYVREIINWVKASKNLKPPNPE